MNKGKEETLPKEIWFFAEEAINGWFEGAMPLVVNESDSGLVDAMGVEAAIAGSDMGVAFEKLALASTLLFSVARS
jgi:hypothetical protein